MWQEALRAIKAGSRPTPVLQTQIFFSSQGVAGRMTHIIQFENVGLRYGNASETLSDLSFSLRRGGFYFLTGPSGAGKTSLLKLLYLAQRPSRCVVRLFGDDLAPSARVEPHGQWLGPLVGVMRSLVWLSGLLVVLMAAACCAIIVWAARSALNTHRATLEVMHLLGASDAQIARLFQRRLGLDALFGASLGFFAGSLAILLLGYRFTAMGSELLGSLGLGVLGWLALLALPLATALLAMLAARLTVLAALRHML